MSIASVCLLLAVWTSSLVPLGEKAGAGATVLVDRAEIFDQPSDRAYVSGELKSGDRVIVRNQPAVGWLAIEPPANSVIWLESSAIEDSDLNRIVVSREDALIRSGHWEARFPGPPLGRLERGTVVVPLNKSPVKFAGQAWRAIAPPPGQLRFVREESLRREAIRDAVVQTALSVPSEIADELRRLDASVKGVLRGPVEDWQFAALVGPYSELRDRATTSEAKATVQARLDRIEAFERLAKSTSGFRLSYSKSRSLDRETDQFRGGISDDEEQPFDAEGLVQASSKLVDGQRVYALIGKDGMTVAYLDIPAGLDATRWEGKRVGVRGPSRYDESLRAPLITVRDIEKLGSRSR